MKKLLLGLAIGGMTTMSSLTAFAGYEICPAGYLCIWGDANYNGRWQIMNRETANIGNFMNDLTSSYWNRTGQAWCGYYHTNFRGASLLMIPGDSSGWIGVEFNDALSSFRPC